MKDYTHILSDEIEIPEIVMQKADAAFDQIKSEDKIIMIQDTNSKKVIRKRKRYAAAVAAICFFLIGGTTSFAAIRHYWGRGMSGTIQATDEQQQQLTDDGMATIYTEQSNYEALAVTSGNVTITPKTVIVDENYAYLSFAVTGYQIGYGVEPDFEQVDTIMADGSDVSSCSSFYSGVIADENGGPVYDDGTSVKYNEDGATIYRYATEDGELEYVIQMMPGDQDKTLLGKTVTVHFENLGTVYKAGYTNAVEGEWNFDIELPNVSAAKKFDVNKNVPGTRFAIDSMEVSEISIRLHYSVEVQPEICEDENGVPEFMGFVLKDGTKLPYVTNGCSTGYADGTMRNAYAISAYDRVIDPDQISALLVCTKDGMVEVDL